MDFLADENVPRPIIERLRLDGFTIHAIAEKGAGAADADVLAAANQGGLILITQDQDFGELVILRQLPVVGVVLLEVARLPLKAQVERIAQLIAAEHTSFAGNLTVIEPGRTRVRPLPDSSP
jgi:predicted nuclease of predicted toxin-antitoxin system